MHRLSVVGTSVGALPEMILHGVSGHTVDHANDRVSLV
jgi:hypothetical protein